MRVDAAGPRAAAIAVTGVRILIRGGTILTLDAGGRILAGEDVIVDGDRIARVGGRVTEQDGPFDRVLDARQRLVMPGLVNAHFHSDGVFLRGAFEELPLEVWLLYVSPMFHAPRSDREVRVRAQLAAAEMLLSGTTTCVDNISLGALDDAIVGATVRAYRDIGIRACPAPMIGDRPFSATVPYADAMLPAAERALVDRVPPPVADILEFQRRVTRDWDGCDGRIHVRLAPSAPQRCTDELLAAFHALAVAEDRPLHIHVLETKVQAVTARERYGVSMVARLAERKLLSPQVVVVHGVWLSAEDVALLAEHGVTVVHNPACNLRLRSGVAPVRSLASAGVGIALGTDNTSANDGHNLFGALRLAALLQTLDGPAPGTGSPAARALHMAVSGGARAAGLGGDVGAVEVGRRADLVLLDLTAFPFVPLNDPVLQLVYSETGSSVRTVLVDGRIVVEEGRLLTVDADDLRAEAREVAAGFLADHRVARRQAARLRPYLEEIHRRAVGQDIGLDAFLPRR
jgi:5-methylthioadenosine/S-adenosylhomocysteine deaminase